MGVSFILSRAFLEKLPPAFINWRLEGAFPSFTCSRAKTHEIVELYARRFLDTLTLFLGFKAEWSRGGFTQPHRLPRAKESAKWRFLTFLAGGSWDFLKAGIS